MSIRYFLPSDQLVRIAQKTLAVVAYIAAITSGLAALALAGYVLIWFCGVLVLFIHALSSVFQAAYIALGSSWVANDAGFIFLVTLSIVASIKFVCIIFPSLPAFFIQGGARV